MIRPPTCPGNRNRYTRFLQILDTGGAEVTRLANGYHRVTEPSWSPDGRLVVFAGIRVEGDSYQVFLEPVP